MSSFKKASKKKQKLRLAIFGASGSGKTKSALRIAVGIANTLKKRIAVIDSEYESASLYADEYDFDTVSLEGDKSIETYTKYLKEVSNNNEYGVVIIDSLSHAWKELLEDVEKLAKTKYNGNTFRAWGEGTPKQQKLIHAILSCKCHVIATMRSKTEWVMESDNNGKPKPTRVGLTPEQGKGIEYEFTMLMEITPEHYANIIKDRSGKFQDKMFEKPNEEFGAELLAWLQEGYDQDKSFKDAINDVKTCFDIECLSEKFKKYPEFHANKEFVSLVTTMKSDFLKDKQTKDVNDNQ